jgi:hypothetical protein
MNEAELLAAYEQQIRRGPTVGAGWRVEPSPDGRVLAHVHPEGSAQSVTVLWSDLDESTAEAAIAAAVERYDALAKPWEWKTFGHDRPLDLGDRLAAAGFVAGDVEALLIGDTAAVLAACGSAPVADGIRLRGLSGADDFDRIVRLEEAVWGENMAWLGHDLATVVAADPDSLVFCLAELPEGELASAGWVRLEPGTDFASLWGGSTLAHWRGRGLYRAIVARRAELAVERGRRYLQVDASPDSRPILERLGLRAVTTTTPYTRRPGGAE